MDLMRVVNTYVNTNDRHLPGNGTVSIGGLVHGRSNCKSEPRVSRAALFRTRCASS